MLQARRRPGVLCYNRELYAFGGYKSDYLRTTEKFLFDKEKWVEVGLMYEARSGISPVIYKDFAILAGDGSRVVEKFMFELQTFVVLKMQMPFDSWSIVFQVDDNLIFLQRNKTICTTLIEGSESISKAETVMTSDNWWYSQTAPVRYESKIYFLRYR